MPSLRAWESLRVTLHTSLPGAKAARTAGSEGYIHYSSNKVDSQGEEGKRFQGCGYIAWMGKQGSSPRPPPRTPNEEEDRPNLHFLKPRWTAENHLPWKKNNKFPIIISMAPRINTKESEKLVPRVLPEPEKWYLSVIRFYFFAALHFIHIYSCRTEAQRYWGWRGSGRKSCYT